MTHTRELSHIELIDGASHATREKIPDNARFYLLHRGEKKWFKPGTRVVVVWEDDKQNVVTGYDPTIKRVTFELVDDVPQKEEM
jgi:hypothetical protein